MATILSGHVTILRCVVPDVDSIPFVAITLLTPTEGMTGGETVLQRGDGTELSVAFPQAGYLIVLQVPLPAFTHASTHSCTLHALLISQC